MSTPSTTPVTPCHEAPRRTTFTLKRNVARSPTPNIVHHSTNHAVRSTTTPHMYAALTLLTKKKRTASNRKQNMSPRYSQRRRVAVCKSTPFKRHAQPYQSEPVRLASHINVGAALYRRVLIISSSR